MVNNKCVKSEFRINTNEKKTLLKDKRKKKGRLKVGPLWDKEKGSLFFFYAGVASLYSKNSKPASLLRIEIWISQNLQERQKKKKNRKKNCLFLFPNTSSIDEERKKNEYVTEK